MTNKILPLTLAALAISVCIYYNPGPIVPQPPKDTLPSDFMYKRKFFEEPIENQKLQQAIDGKEDGIFSIVSYEVDFQARVDEHNNEDQLVSTQGANINAVADVYTKFHNATQMYDVAVAYRSISKFEEFQGDQNQAPTGNPETESDEMAMFIISVSAETGALSNFRVPDQGDHSKYLKWATEQLITNIFPEIRPDAYKPEFAVIEQDNFGNYKARYIASDLDKNEIKLHKEYNTHDYVQKAQNFIENPHIVFNSNVTIDKELGVATQGHSRHLFTVGHMEAQAEGDLHTMGKYQGSIVEQFAHRNTDDQAKFDIQEFINNNQFKEIELQYEQKIQVQFQNFNQNLQQEKEEESIKLTHHHHHHFHHIRPRHIVHEATKHIIKPIIHNPIATAYAILPKPVKHIVHEAVTKPMEKIVKQTIVKPAEKVLKVTVETPLKKIVPKIFKVLPKQVQMAPLPPIVFPTVEKIDTTGTTFEKIEKIADLKVLKNELYVDLEYYDYSDHSVLGGFVYLNEKPVYQIFKKSIPHCVPFDKEYPYHQKYQLFQVTYPVFGVIWLQFEVTTNIDMNLSMTGQDTVDSCIYKFIPSISAGLEAEGSVSLVGVLKAGVWAKGYFLDAEMDLIGSVNRHTFTVDASLNASYKAYAVQIGFEYTRINCHMKHLLKNLFSMKKLCDIKPNSEKVIYSKDSKPYNKMIWQKSYQAKI